MADLGTTGNKVAITYPDHPTKYQLKQPTGNWEIALLHTGSTPWCQIWAQSSVEEATRTFRLSISQIGPQTTEKHPFLLSSSASWWQIWAPPGGKVGMTYLNIHMNISQIGPHTTEKKQG